MIEPGTYTLTMVERGVEVSRTGVEVVEVQLPLMRVRHGGREWFLNINASTFVGAELESGKMPKIVLSRERQDALATELA
jgi:hypothetical protein